MEADGDSPGPDRALDIVDDSLPPAEQEGVCNQTLIGTLAGNVLRLDPNYVVPEGEAFFIISPNNPLRLLCVAVVNSKYFQYGLLLLILLNAVSMAATDPTLTLEEREADSWQRALYYFDLGCLCIYAVEMLLKFVAMGVFLGPTSYWKDTWNKLDLIVIISSWLGWIGTRQGIKGPTRGVNALRVFRALKPLRVVKSLPAVRAILESLSNSIPLLASTTLLFCFFFLTFSIIALEFYQESLSRRCVVGGEYITPTFLGSNYSSALSPTPTVTLFEGRETIAPTYCNVDKTFGVKCEAPKSSCELLEAPFAGAASFDNIASSSLLLFQIVTLDSWSNYLYALGDAENWLWTLFYVTTVIVLISFVVINLFLAVIHTTFVEVRQEQQRSAFVDAETAAVHAARTAEENRAENIIERIAQREAPNPTCIAPFNTIQPMVAKAVDSKPFEAVVNAMIILSVGLQIYEASGSGNVDTGIVWGTEVAFIVFFFSESLLRFVKFGTPAAFITKDGWNSFDLLIVILSLIGLLADNTTFRFFRAFRLLRVISMAKDMEGLQRLLQAAFAGIVPTFNVLVFSLFILFVFACMGMSLFGGHFDRHRDEDSPFSLDEDKVWLAVIDRLNFDRFETAFILLFQIMTGDNWSLFMWYSMNIDIPAPWVQASVYFIAYYFISGLIILSLFTVVILENFELSQEEKQLATRRLRKNIERAMRVGLQARKNLGLNTPVYHRETRPVAAVDMNPVLTAIKERMTQAKRKQSLAPVRLPISDLLMSIATHHSDADLQSAHDILDESLAGLDASLHDEHMLAWIAAAHTTLSSAFLHYWSQTSILYHNTLVKTCKLLANDSILETLEQQLMSGLGLGQRALMSVAGAEWGEGGVSKGLVRQLAKLGKLDNPKTLSTLTLYEVCLAETYARRALVNKEASVRLFFERAFKSNRDWCAKDMHCVKIQSVIRRYLVKSSMQGAINLQRQERTVRELIEDSQHSEWHQIALATAPLPELRFRVRDNTWDNPLAPEKSIVTPQKYYKGLLEFKRKYLKTNEYGLAVDELSKVYAMRPSESVMSLKEGLQLILNGDFVVAAHRFQEADKSTLQQAFLRTRRYAKEALKITEAAFADIYLRSAYNMHLEQADEFEPQADTASEFSEATIDGIEVSVPHLLFAPEEQPARLLDTKDLAKAKNGYCSFCTHHALHGDTVYHVTASRAAALTQVEAPVGRPRRLSVSFAAGLVGPRERPVFGASPPASPASYSPGYTSPPGVVPDDVSPSHRRRRVVLNELPHDAHEASAEKENLVRQITEELSRDNSESRGNVRTAPDTEGERCTPSPQLEETPEEKAKHNALSFGVFSPEDACRRLCDRITRSVWFNLFITAVIIVSSVVVLWQPSPEAWDKTPSTPEWMFYLELGFIAIFLIEAGMKCVAATFYSAGDDSYIADSWNKLDFVVLVCQVIAAVLPTVRFLALIKALRPLRLVSQMEGLQVVLGALLASLRTFVNVFIAGTFFLFLCALVGYHLFHDRFDKCTHPGWTGWESREDCVGTSVASVGGVVYLVPVAWIKSQSATFDTIQAAMATCLEISSLSSWSSLAYQSMDITDVGRQPKTNHSTWAIIYYIIVITVCTLFLVNLFIGVIITNINTHRGMELMDDRQQEWALLSRTLSLVKMPVVSLRPEGGGVWGGVRRWCFDIAEKPLFAQSVLGVIIVNIIVMASASRHEPSDYSTVRKGLNYVFLTIYVLEMVVKLLAYGKKYFADAWNIFDFIIVWGSLLSIGYALIVSGETLTVLSVARIFRIGRIFRLARRFKGVATMFHTLIVSLPQILNISLMMLLLVFIYTVVGMNYFSHIKFQYALNKNANFRSFSSALSIVFRMVTLDDWNKVMRDCTVQPPYCTLEDGIDDCGSRWAFVYFFSFFIIGSYIFLNLVIAVILDNFTHTFSRSKQLITDEDIALFTSTWMQHDPTGTGRLPRYKLSDFTLSLFDNNCNIATQSCFHPVEFSMRYKALLYELDLKVSKKNSAAKFQLFKRATEVPMVQFEDVLMTMCKAYHGFPGLTFDELNERAAKEVSWEISLGAGVLARTTRMCIGLKQAKAEINNPVKWAALEQIRARLLVLQRQEVEEQQEKLQTLYMGYARSRYEVEDTPEEGDGGAWAGELERVPRDGTWCAITLAAIYAPPSRRHDYEAGLDFIQARLRRGSSFGL